MAEHTLKELNYDGAMCVVECANRDKSGNVISSTYATKTALSAEETARENGDTNSLTEAKTYTDTKISAEATARATGDSDTLTSAKEYTDTKVSSEATSRQTGDTNTLSSANSYTDTKISKLGDTYVKYTSSTQSVAGVSKSVAKTTPSTLYVSSGFIMGGTAAAAGLVTRGICGVMTPDDNGACVKDNLYLNYDGNNNYSRKVVLGAGSVGTAMTGGAYAYSAVRGDQMASYVSSYVTGKTSDMVTISTDQTIKGIKTFDAPTNVSGTEQATATFNTANGGKIIFGKEGPNSGSMIALEQTAGTRRLNFRASDTPGAIVWSQPESGSCLYMDVQGVNFRQPSSIYFSKFANAGYLYTNSSGALQKGTLAKVATSGSYNDLSNKPTIPEIVPATEDTLGSIKTGYKQTGKTYPVLLDTDSNAYVSVPWTDTTYTLPTATASALGGVKSSTTGTTKDRDYNVQVNSDGTMKVNVPWVNTTYTLPLATDTARGGIKIGYAQTGKNYPVELSAEKAYVNVPWTDTTYSNATTSASGLMSATDKTKLDGIAEGANNYSLPTATSSVLGGVKLYTDTVQTVGANSVTKTALRTYAIQKNSSSQLVVNVPWVDTNTTYTLTGSDATLTFKPSSGTASTITINNVAHATSADSATKATQDGNGNSIVDTYATEAIPSSTLKSILV